MRNSILKKAISVLLSAALLLGVCACSDGGAGGKKNGLSDSTTDLMANVKPSANVLAFHQDEDRQKAFASGYSDFALTLFRKCAAMDPKKNTLVSPLSVMTALAMTANGASGETLEQMNQTLCGAMTSDELNRYLGAYLNALPSDEKAKFASANSIWLRENSLDFKKEFLQTNADYFGADVYSSRFDDKTLSDINRWVSDNTDGMIPSILNEIPADALMYLINALSLDAEWKDIYREDQIHDGEFTDIDGKTKTVSMMSAEESCYLQDGKAKGFMKPYASGYSFVAMLPDEGVSLEDYVKSMSYAEIVGQIKSKNHVPVRASIPKFSAEYSTELSRVLEQAGMPDAFDAAKADFSGMADVKPGDLFISRVIHKTAIQVDERGTKAGAATAVEMSKNAVMLNYILFDRPFIYMIIDNENCLPIFTGQVTHIQ